MDKKIEYATPAEIVNIFRGLSVGTLANWRSAKRGPCYRKCGRRVLYRIEDVRRFVESEQIKTLDQY